MNGRAEARAEARAHWHDHPQRDSSGCCAGCELKTLCARASRRSKFCRWLNAHLPARVLSGGNRPCSCAISGKNSENKSKKSWLAWLRTKVVIARKRAVLPRISVSANANKPLQVLAAALGAKRVRKVGALSGHLNSAVSLRNLDTS